MPLILLGGINRLDTVQSALDEGFAYVAMARALLRQPDLPNRWQAGTATEGNCIHCNRCMPTIYSGTRCAVDHPEPLTIGPPHRLTGARRLTARCLAGDRRRQAGWPADPVWGGRSAGAEGASSATAGRGFGPAAGDGGVAGEPKTCCGLSSPACTRAKRIVSTFEPSSLMSERIPRKMKPRALTNAAKATPTSDAVITGSTVDKISQLMKSHNK